MKMKPEHYHFLKGALLSFAQRHEGLLIEHRARHSPKRFRWDWLYGSGIDITTSHNLREDSGRIQLPLYDYLDDTHIDTALRSIVAEWEVCRVVRTNEPGYSG